jgi:uncharacterized linocin/CFP29 family protein
MPNATPKPVVISDSMQFNANGGTQFSGSAAQRLMASGFDPSALRTNGTLQKDEWILLDTEVVDIARKNLVITMDLMSRGLTFSLPNALGTTRLEWEKVSDMEGAIITMSGLSQSQNDRIVYDLDGMPIPIIHKDFNINLRALAASRKRGEALDVTQARIASRKVSETIETLIFDGATVLGANNPIYGLRTAPYRNTGSLSESWATADGTSIINDAISMAQMLVDDNMYGPYVVYIGTNVALRFAEDYKTDSDKTIMNRLMELPTIADVKWSKDLPANEVIMVQMTSDVIELVDGMQPTTVEWETHGGFVVNFKVMAIIIPRIRNDFLNQSGIAHFSA